MKPLYCIIAIVVVLLAIIGQAYAWQVNGESPGTWSISPRDLISGESTVLELRYVNGSTALPANSYFRFTLEGMSCSSLVNTPASTDMAIVPYIGQAPQVTITKGNPGGVNETSVKLAFPNGLAANQSFALRIGNKDAQENIIALVNPTPVHNLGFNIYADLSGSGQETDWFASGWYSTLPKVDIEGGPASALRIFAPSVVRAGTQFKIRIAVTDNWDSRAYPDYTGEVVIEPVSGATGLPTSISYTSADRCSKVISGIKINTPGVYRVVGSLSGGTVTFESNPIVVKSEEVTPIYWGLLHGHDWYSEGWGDGAWNYYQFAREISGLDYVALSDHRGWCPAPHQKLGRIYAYRNGRTIDGVESWLDNVAAADANNVNGSFVAIAGYENGYLSCNHFNIYWADLNTSNYAQMFNTTANAFPMAGIEWFKQLENVLVMPHLHGGYAPYEEFYRGVDPNGKPVCPAFEIYSDWGMSFPGPGVIDPVTDGVVDGNASPLYKVIGRGKKFAFLGDSDDHAGLPGRRSPVGICHGNFPQGLTAALGGELTRHGIIDTYKSMSTYATSGERIYVDFKINGVGCGQLTATDQPVVGHIQVAGTDIIETITLYNGETVVEQLHPGTKDVTHIFNLPDASEREVPYMVEVIQANHHRAWTTAVWVRKASMPNLRWEQGTSNDLYLVNDGTAAASDVRVMLDSAQYSFAVPSIVPVQKPGNYPCGQVWLTRWNDHRATVFFHVYGAAVNGTARISGMYDYFGEKDLPLSRFGSLADAGDGNLSFNIPNKNEWVGFGISYQPMLDRPCKLVLDFDSSITVWYKGQSYTGTTLEVPLNGLQSAPAIDYVIPEIPAGGRRQTPAGSGVWSADPFNSIPESSEEDNMITFDAINGADMEPPQGSISINSGDMYTEDITTELVTAASDDRGVLEMRFSNDSVTWSGWEPYGVSRQWNLVPGDGKRTVYAQFADAFGNVSLAVSDSIYLADIVTVPRAKQITGGVVVLKDVTVTVKCDGYAYAQAGDEPFGIRTKGNINGNVGSVVDLVGYPAVNGGEKCFVVLDSRVTGNRNVEPLMLTLRDLGGSDLF